MHHNFRRHRAARAARLALTLLLACLLLPLQAALAAPVVLFNNYDPGANFEPTTGLNIWSACTGRAMPFTVAQTASITQIDVPLGNWGIADRGNLVIEIMPDYGAQIPGYISAPNANAVIETVVHNVTDWAGTHMRQFSIALSGTTVLQPGVVYWLGISLDKVVPVGIPGLTWWGSMENQSGPLASRSGMAPGAYWYPSRYNSVNALRVTGETIATPTPASLWLLGSAVAGLIARRRLAP